jgi:predicted nicotinamide N-methyase
MLNEITRQEPGLECFKPVPFTRPAQLYLTFNRHSGWAQIKQDATATLGRQPDYSAFGWN